MLEVKSSGTVWLLVRPDYKSKCKNMSRATISECENVSMTSISEILRLQKGVLEITNISEC